MGGYGGIPVRNGFALCLFCVTAASFAGGVPWSHFNIIDAPSAHLLRHTEVAVGGAFAPFSIEDSSGSSATEFSYGAYLEVGILNRGQVGATYISEGGSVPGPGRKPVRVPFAELPETRRVLGQGA